MSRYVVQVSAGVGPIPVRRFVAQLAARLATLCEEQGLVVRETVVRGDEREPSSVDLVVDGDAPARLAGERGTHALVARAAERGRAARKRWFAGVTIHALDERDDGRKEAEIDPRDLDVQATRASGPGGQHVNKTSTAVRVHHRPSGITVRVSDERSQRANLRRAVDRIGALLASATMEKSAAGEAARRAAHYRFERGVPVRIYRIGTRGELEVHRAS